VLVQHHLSRHRLQQQPVNLA